MSLVQRIADLAARIGVEVAKKVDATDLGTAASADLTTSATDTTPGRVTRAGDYGWGGEPETLSGSWNDLSGQSRLVKGALNAMTDGPLTGALWLFGQYVRLAAGNGYFCGHILSAPNPRTFLRILSGGVWQQWIEIAEQGRDATFAALTSTSRLKVKTGNSGAETVAGFGNYLIEDGLQIVTDDGNLTWGINALNSRSLTLKTNQTDRHRISGSGTHTFSGQIEFSDTSGVIRTNTSDGADSKRLILAGGGSTIYTRGAYVVIGGNESSNPGQIVMICGNSGTERLLLMIGGADAFEVDVDRNVKPGSDNAQNLGVVTRRWKDIYLANAPTVSSDQALKTPRRDFLDAELDAIDACELGLFQWLDAVSVKGDAARLHAGVIAQQVIKAFESRGLDPYHYGPICRDPIFEDRLVEERTVTRKRQVTRTVPSEDRRIEIIDGIPTEIVEVKHVEEPVFEMRPVVRQDGTPVTQSMPVLQDDGTPLLDEAGQPVTTEQPVMHQCHVMEDYEDLERVTEQVQTGWRYSIRYDELLIMLVADVRRKNERLAERLAALESAQ